MFQENNNVKCKIAWQTPILKVPLEEEWAARAQIEGKIIYDLVEGGLGSQTIGPS